MMSIFFGHIIYVSPLTHESYDYDFMMTAQRLLYDMFDFALNHGQ